jgi:hypothetical protein
VWQLDLTVRAAAAKVRTNMYASAYDAERLVLIALQSKGVSADTDFVTNVLEVERLGDDALRRPDHVASLIILAESDNAPSAKHRQRLAAVEARIPRLNVAVVGAVRSTVMVMTAINWLAPSRPGLLRSVHASYELAREWHVARGVHPRAVFDALHESVRRKCPV